MLNSLNSSVNLKANKGRTNNCLFMPNREAKLIHLYKVEVLNKKENEILK